MTDLKEMSQNIVNILKSGINSKDYNYIQKNVSQILNNYKPSSAHGTTNTDKVIKKYYDKLPRGYDIEALTEDYFNTTSLEDLEIDMGAYIDYDETDTETVERIKKHCKAAIKNFNDSEKNLKKVLEVKNKLNGFLKELEAAQKKDKTAKQKAKKK